MTEQHPEHPHHSQYRMALGILLLAVIGGLAFYLFQPSPPRVDVREAVTPVDVIKVSPSEEQINIVAYGTIEGKRVLFVNPEVGGKLIRVSKNFDKGRVVDQGEVLVQIDPRDYESAVEQARAALEKADFEFKVEKGRGVVAQREWEILHGDSEDDVVESELALRLPHMKEKEAAVKAAEKKLEKAELDLARTRVVAPFRGFVIEETAEVGQIVSPGTRLGQIVAVDEFRAQVSVPYEKLKWLDLTTPYDEGQVKARVIFEVKGGKTVERDAVVLNLLGDLDPKGRLVRILVGIKDPLGLDDPSKASEPMLLGSYVRVEIEGEEEEDVYVLPRQALREDSKVWIKDKHNRLEMRDVRVVVRQPNQVIIDDGLEPGDQVIVSPISVPVPGMALK